MSSAEDRSRGPGGTPLLKIGRLAALVLTACAPATAGTVAEGASTSQAVIPASLVFDGVTVVDVKQGKLVSDQRVVIAGNRIRTVGSVRSVSMPKGTQVVDARGKYLIPGLWDMHTHANRRTHLYYPLFIANGVTGIRDAGSEVPLDTLVLWRREILANARIGPPRQVLSGQAIDEEQSCTRTKRSLHTCVTAGDTTDARHLVDSLQAAGADMIKTYDLSKDMYFVIAAEARRVHIPFGGHVETLPATAASDSGAGIVDHSIANEELADHCLYGETASVEQCRPVAERFARNGTWWVPTWVMPPRVAGGVLSQSIYTRFEAFLYEFWADQTPYRSLYDYLRGAVTFSPIPLSSRLDSTPPRPPPGGRGTPDSVGYLYVVRNAGLPILAGTDAAGLDASAYPVYNIKHAPGGFTLHVELATYVAEGLTPVEALQTATLNPAKFLQATDSLGTVAPGKLADLVLLDADPLADITNTAAIRAVVANGRYFDRAALDGLLVEVRAKAQHP